MIISSIQSDNKIKTQLHYPILPPTHVSLWLMQTTEFIIKKQFTFSLGVPIHRNRFGIFGLNSDEKIHPQVSISM